MEMPEKVNIRPGTSILSILKHIEYDPWFALAEFVDNAIDSYLKHEQELKNIEGENFQLIVRIDINDTDNKIIIRDNAAGIHEKDYQRAFRAAEIPPNNTGLSEFGMGMKSAACWFSDNWLVKTSALGEPVEKSVTFDLQRIFYDKIDELEIIAESANVNTHFTLVELFNLNKFPQKKTKTKIKEHLKSIYRDFIRNDVLQLIVDGETLKYETPKVLKAPFPFDSDNPPIIWKKEIDFNIDANLRVHGFVAIREIMNGSESGFALFRRGRVIEGSVDEGFRPKEIVGEAGSPEFKRIFGELHLEGFNVSFTKKGIKWDENMEVFLSCLKDELTHKDFPLIRMAREYRVKPTTSEIKKTAELVLQSATDEIKQSVPNALAQARVEAIDQHETTKLNPTEQSSIREFEVSFNDTIWIISIELCYDPAISNWIEVGSHTLRSISSNKSIRRVGVRMSMIHPFVTNYAGIDKSRLEPILRIAAAFGLAEETAREAGLAKAGTVRMNLNKLIKSLSKI